MNSLSFLTSGSALRLLDPQRALFIQKANECVDQAVPSNKRQRVWSSLIRAYDNQGTRLFLESLNLTSIDGLVDCLRHLPTLTELHLSYNQLQTLPESLGALTNLQDLRLQGNQLQTLPESFGNLTALRNLYLDNTQLQILPESFGSLTNLHTLDLNNNQLQTLPESFGSLTNLHTLVLSYNQLQTLPESFGNLTALRNLYLDNTQLQILPESFGSLTNLHTLDLTNNQLQTLPENFGSLTNLQDLKLQGNQLQTLPESFGSLTKLHTLDLNNNQLQTLPESFGSLTKLHTLDLNNNQLQTLPESFGSLTNLQTLQLQGNQLQTLPESLNALTNLQDLRLQRNQLQMLPESLRALTHLQTLGLEGNRLQTLPESFGSLTKLQTLWLQGNQLQTLPESFGSLTKLHTLDLNNNQLQTLPESFGNLTDLRTLYLFSNPLTSLPNSILALPHQCIFTLEDHALSEEVIASLQSATTAPFYRGPTISFSLPHRVREEIESRSNQSPLSALYSLAQQELEEPTPEELAGKQPSLPCTEEEFLSLLTRLDETQKALLKKMFERIWEMESFRVKGAENIRLARRLVEILHFTSRDEPFRKDFFSEAVVLVETCVDGFALPFISIDILFQLRSASNLLPCLRGLWHLKLISQVAHKKVKTLYFVDEIEVHLAYVLGVKEALQLPTVLNEMRFGRVSQVTDADIKAAKAELLEKNQDEEAFLRFLIETQDECISRKWRDFYSENREVARKVEQIEAKAVEKINELSLELRDREFQEEINRIAEKKTEELISVFKPLLKKSWI